MKINHIIFVIILMLVSACSEKKSPPLKGERINVLHFDSLQERKVANKNIILPAQSTSDQWNLSDDSQISYLPNNYLLATDLKNSRSISLRKFSPVNKDSSVAIVKDVALTYARGVLAANDIEKNKLLWSLEVVTGKDRADILSGSIAVVDNIAYVASGTKDLVAVNIIDGKEQWRYSAPNVLRYVPYVNHGMIFVTTIDNIINCISLDGKLLWRYDAASFSIASNNIYSPSLVHDNKFFSATTAGDLAILNKNDGSELLQVNLANMSIIGDGSIAKGPIVSPYLDRNFLYILTGESELIKIDLNIPGVVWRHNYPGAVSTWIAQDTSFMLMDNNQLIAIDNNDAKIIWVVDLPQKTKNKQDDFFGPILAGDKLYLNTAKGDLYAFSPYDGKMLKRYDTIPSNSSPLVANGKLFIVGKNGKLNIWQ